MKSKWSYAALGAGILIVGVGVGIGGIFLIDSIVGGDSSHVSSPDVLATPVDIRQVMTPDDKMNAFLSRSGVTSPSDQATFRDLAHWSCNTIADTPYAKLDVHAMLLHKFTGTDFKDDHSAEVFLGEAIRDYCPEHSDMIPK